MATSKKEARKSALKEMLAKRFKGKGGPGKDKYSKLKESMKEAKEDKKEEASESPSFEKKEKD